MTSDLPLHGGDIISASARYNIPVEEWIDLSTGINPDYYPVADINLSAFCQLPYLNPEFYSAARHYYLKHQQVTHQHLKHPEKPSSLLAVAGTQVAIQAIPQILADYSVLLPDIGYQEHRLHWQKNTSTIVDYPATSSQLASTFIDEAINKNNRQHLVVINPNNPTGVLFPPSQLITWAKQLDNTAYLIIDEAFIDSTPAYSVLNHSLPTNIIVLRSFGKFYGLAGIRLGFVFSHENIIHSLEKKIGIWQVNGPAQVLATRALRDEHWQKEAIQCIRENALHTQQCCKSLSAISTREVHSDLFSSYFLSQTHALLINRSLAKKGILTRVILLNSAQEKEAKQEHATAILRIGRLPIGQTENSQKLTQTITDATQAIVETNHDKMVQLPDYIV